MTGAVGNVTLLEMTRVPVLSVGVVVKVPAVALFTTRVPGPVFVRVATVAAEPVRAQTEAAVETLTAADVAPAGTLNARASVSVPLPP